MNLLIKSAKIVDSESKHNNKVVDILIEKGLISQISENINPNTLKGKKIKELSLDNLHISPGWFDSSVSLGEPGYEERETIENGLRVAGLSGFTSILLNPLTDPVIDSQADIKFLQGKASGHAVKLYPSGALTAKSEGKELAELYDMSTAGAKAFYDYKKPISDSNTMKMALQYTAGFEAIPIVFPYMEELSRNGVMNEGPSSTVIGLKGIPAISEELRVNRDLTLLEYTSGRIHFATISTSRSVELIREAKSKGLNVSCSVAIHNLIFTDEKLDSFNSNFKVLPPLRTEDDRLALIEGLKDGTIDMATSDHNPLNIELKKVEFDHAEFGTIGLESAFGALRTIFPAKKCVVYLTKGKELFGINPSN
ncbi:MAG: dihydroorotase, partial [Flavobacteriaceae bacterium]|nr:dihydroorotase [Flavobacteriaceae bacterium]